MTDQFKKFLFLFPSLGFGAGVFIILFYILEFFLNSDSSYGAFVFVPIFFVPSATSAWIFYRILVKKIITDKYQNSANVQEETQDIYKNTLLYFFSGLSLIIFQALISIDIAIDSSESGILLVFLLALGFIYWPLIFKKQMSIVKKIIFSFALFFSPLIITTLASFLFID